MRLPGGRTFLFGDRFGGRFLGTGARHYSVNAILARFDLKMKLSTCSCLRRLATLTIFVETFSAYSPRSLRSRRAGTGGSEISPMVAFVSLLLFPQYLRYLASRKRSED